MGFQGVGEGFAELLLLLGLLGRLEGRLKKTCRVGFQEFRYFGMYKPSDFLFILAEEIEFFLNLVESKWNALAQHTWYLCR